MKHILIMFLLVFSTIAAAKVEIWECYFNDGSGSRVYKLDTEPPSAAYREGEKWVYHEDVIYERENESLYKEEYYVWDLLLTEWFFLGTVNECKVIDP